jgi:hypothetical protein
MVMRSYLQSKAIVESILINVVNSRVNTNQIIYSNKIKLNIMIGTATIYST